MKLTEILKLKKPDVEERYNIEIFNENLDKIDTAFGESKKLEAHLTNRNNPHKVTKGQIGLDNVDNTKDIDKPISNAVQRALNGKQDIVPLDSKPTKDSKNWLTSGAVFEALQNVFSKDVIKTIEEAKDVKSKAAALDAKSARDFYNKTQDQYAEQLCLVSGNGEESLYKYGSAAPRNYSQDEIVYGAFQNNWNLFYKVKKAITKGSTNFSQSMQLISLTDILNSLFNKIKLLEADSKVKPTYTAAEVGAYDKAEVDALLGSVAIQGLSDEQLHEIAQIVGGSYGTGDSNWTLSFEALYGECVPVTYENNVYIFGKDIPQNKIVPLKITVKVNSQFSYLYSIVKTIQAIEKDIAYSVEYLDECIDVQNIISLISSALTALPFELKIQDGQYGYVKQDGTFVPFESQNNN